MGNKKTILILIVNFLPGYKGGGPIKSIKNLTDHLSNEFNFKIITSDRDLGDKQSYPHITTNQWNNINGIDVFYASRNFLHFHSLIELINKTDFDILYLNSFFQPIFSIQPVMAKYLRLLKSSNIILAPRGELEKGCLKIKPFKKKLFINISRFLGIHNDITWHATSEFEAISIKNMFHEKAKKINIAMNLTPKQHETIFDELDFNYKNQDVLKICFISRITREKNLDYALNIINNVSVRTIFNIYGTNHEDSKYWHKCEALIKQINNKNYHQINYLGSVSPEKVNDILKQHDLFFFPTVGENFAHVIFESLAAGTPVLISDRTPWLNLKEKGFRNHYILGMNNGLDQKNIDSIVSKWTEEKTTKWMELNDYQNKKIIISCARLETKNNFRLVIEALPKIVQKIPNLLWFLIGGGDEEENLKKLASKLRVEKHIVFLGAIYEEEKLAPYFLSSLLFIHPAAIGLSLLHAFGYGIPVIVHDQINLHGPEYAAFQNDLTGKNFKFNDPDDLANVIITLLNNPNKINQMKRNVQKIAREQYNVDIMVNRFIQMANYATYK